MRDNQEVYLPGEATVERWASAVESGERRPPRKAPYLHSACQLPCDRFIWKESHTLTRDEYLERTA